MQNQSDGILPRTMPACLQFETEWPRADQGGLQKITEHLGQYGTEHYNGEQRIDAREPCDKVASDLEGDIGHREGMRWCSPASPAWEKSTTLPKISAFTLQPYPLPISKGNCVMFYEEADDRLLALLVN